MKVTVPEGKHLLGLWNEHLLQHPLRMWCEGKTVWSLGMKVNYTSFVGQAAKFHSSSVVLGSILNPPNLSVFTCIFTLEDYYGNYEKHRHKRLSPMPDTRNRLRFLYKCSAVFWNDERLSHQGLFILFL